MDKQPNLNNLIAAVRYKEQTYYTTEEPKFDRPGIKFEVFHKHEGGYTWIATFMMARPEYQWLAHIWFSEKGQKHFKYHDTIEETNAWIFEQYTAWLDEQFEKAFMVD